ncbi:MAG: DNA translocase FtsK 4TM domain-containing protein, partial [Holosporales bacterium]|nr:DNA translocase FtsK 4TM domain-containing protein [Holosporales bacterium]
MAAPKIQEYSRSAAGSFFLGLSLFLSFALFYYNAEEPSWNTSVGTLENYWFICGNTLADVLIQFFGLVAWISPVLLFVLGVGILQKLPIGKIIWRSVGIILFLSLALGNISVPSWSVPLGGAFGHLLLRASTNALRPWLQKGTFLIAPISGVLGIWLCWLTFGSLVLRFLRKERLPLFDRRWD